MTIFDVKSEAHWCWHFFFPRLENRETWGTPSSGSANENRVDMVRGMWATRLSIEGERRDWFAVEIDIATRPRA
jgi:hypothetical protein